MLTFDDGPDAKRGPILLDTLKKYGVQATFFMVGENINATTSETNLQRELRDGHLIGAHSLHHLNSNTLSEAAFKKDLWESISKLFPAMKAEGIHQKEVYFRYPFGAYDAKTYNQMNTIRELSYEKYGENCINFVFWNVDSEDWVAAMTPEKIADGIMAQLEGGTAYEHVLVNGKYQVKEYHVNPATAPKGGVILMHEIHDRSVAAVPLLIEKLKRAGYEIVPLNAVKEYYFAGKTCELKSKRP